MGMGHVPPGPVPTPGQGHELPRRQHRGTRTLSPPLGSHHLARWGESVAASFLERRGASIVGRNRRVGRGEVDLIVSFGSHRAVIEVKTRFGADVDPVLSFTTAKERQVRRLAGSLGIGRVDVITVTAGTDCVDVRWLPEIA